MLWRVLFLLLVLPATAALASSAGSLGSGSGSVTADNPDFADYVPNYSEDNTHRDESFLYFEKDHMISVGSGMDRFSGLMGSGLRPSFPTLDARFAKFFDFRKALEFRVTNARFAGTMNRDVLQPLGLFEMASAANPGNNFAEAQFFRAGVGFKLYAENDTPALWGVSDRPFWSPNYFFGMGFSYGRLMVDMPQIGQEADLNMTVPHLAMGIDFFTRSPSTATNRLPPTLGLEARYTFFGTWLRTIGYRNASAESGSASLGDLLSIGVLANFAL